MCGIHALWENQPLLIIVVLVFLPLQLLIALWLAAEPSPDPPGPPRPLAATSHTDNKSAICALAWLWALTPDAATIDPVPGSRQEAKWLWFITLMHICCLAHGVFVCQLLKTHKPSARVIFLLNQEGLAILQQKAQQTIASLVAAARCALLPANQPHRAELQLTETKTHHVSWPLASPCILSRWESSSLHHLRVAAIQF